VHEVSYRRSSFSQLECVEVALLPDGTVHVRDSKNVDQPPHRFSSAEWAAFVAGVKNGEFDLGLDPGR